MGGLSFFFSVLFAAGLSIWMGILPVSIFSRHIYFFAGLLLIVVAGLADDIYRLNTLLKILTQSLAAVLLIIDGCLIQSLTGPFTGVFPLGNFAVPFTFFWILVIINAINLMDGLDGLAGGVGAIITVGFLATGLETGDALIIVLCIGLLAGLLGFLRYNYHPASIFMGDVGSLQIGYLLAFFSIESLKVASSHQVYFLTSLVFLGVPLSDTLISFLRRLGQGKSPFGADKQHVHHRLLNLGLGQLETVWLLYIFTAIFVVIGLLMVYFQGISGLILFIIALLLSVYWAWRLGYVETRFSHQNLIYQVEKAGKIHRRAPLHVNRIWHILLLLLSDVVTINMGLYFTYWLKFKSGLITPSAYRLASDYFSTPVFLLLLIGWLFLFFVNNLYQMSWDISRFDKVWRVSKVITFGSLFLGLLTIDFKQIMNPAQLYSLLFYWVSLIFFVNLGRLLIIDFEKRFHLFEYSPKKTLIIGCNDLAKKILDDIRSNPHLIFEVIGFISKSKKQKTFAGLPVLGEYADLPALIHQHKIEEIIIALGENATEDFLQILSLTELQQVKIKISPGTHEMFVGRQEGLMSHAYLEIFPQNMVMWQWMIKRLFDVILSLIALVLLSPVFIISALLLWGRFRKSVLLRIPVLGKFGIPFNMYVFRITDEDYDYSSNPIYLGVGPEPKNLTGFPNLFFKSRLYKLPQLVNVFLGDMSFVGPRPESAEWYREYQNSLRFIYSRVMVRPGLTGLAQVKYRYELLLKILQERIKYDIFYIENMTLRLDFRILLRTLLLVFRRPVPVAENEK
ncbi:hypothetical protein B1H10_01685 [candidate division KSB1 bacterium 4484_188]|nr:MAG: hypothetical protein B1H10_01685 [candidate division KSB1 bacterium 4484_188]